MERILRTEQETLKLRLVAALGAAAGLYVHQQELSVFWVLALPIAYLGYVGYSLVLRYYVLPRFASAYLLYGMILVDTAALTSIVFVTGGMNSALIILFPVFISYYAIHLGYAGSFFTATLATAGLGSYVAFAGLGPASERGFALAVAMFYLAATFSGYLGQRGIRSEAEKESLRELLNLESGARSLLEVARTLNRTLELDALLQAIVQLSPRITGLPYCVALLRDEKGDKLVGKAANIAAPELGLGRIEGLVEVLRAGSLAQGAWDTGLPVALSDSTESPEGRLPPPPELRAGCVLAIPLISQGQPLGVIYAYDRHAGHVFSEEALRLATGFGDLTAVAIANAKLYQEAQEKIAVLVEELGTAVQRLERMREPRRKGLITVNGLQIDTSAQKVTVMGQPVELSPTEFRLLQALADNLGTPLSQEVLFRAIWGDVYRGRTNAVDVYIHRLRRKLEDNVAAPKRILTVRGMGYKLNDGS